MIEIVDDQGRKRRYQMSDEGSDVEYTEDEVEQLGVYMGVPDLNQIDWQEAVTELHNKLYDVGLFTMDDILAREGMLAIVITAVLQKKIVSLYSEGDR